MNTFTIISLIFLGSIITFFFIFFVYLEITAIIDKKKYKNYAKNLKVTPQIKNKPKPKPIFPPEETMSYQYYEDFKYKQIHHSKKEELLDLDLIYFNLSTRLINHLKQRNITNLNQIINKTKPQIQNIPNIGPAYFNEINDLINKLKLKFKKKNKEAIITKEHKKYDKSKPIFQYHADGSLINKFDDINQATSELKLTKEYILGCIRKNAFSRKGFYLSQSDSFKYPNKIIHQNPFMHKNTTILD